jgi:hypothetical protein
MKKKKKQATNISDIEDKATTEKADQDEELAGRK